MHKHLLPIVFAATATLVPAAGWSQPAPPAAPAAPTTAEVAEVDPLRCWWRTSSGAVRVGESFSLVLTCAVLQNDAVQVTPDETRLDSAVIQMSPFEMIGGSHPSDLYSGNRRFFQYEYMLRIISPDVIGKDVKIPDPLIRYRINSTVAANTSAEGREHTYLLPPLSVRVMSLVPADAPDIRDASRDTFAAAEQLGFRASVMQIVAITALVLGALVACIGVARLVARSRKGKKVGKRGLTEATMLGVAARELSAVQREAQGGWNDALVGRALAAARIPAAAVLGNPINQHEDPAAEAGEGRLLASRGFRRKLRFVSGGGTAQDLADALRRMPETANPGRRQVIDDLQAAIAAFTAVQYTREATIDGGTLDEAIGRAVAAARRLKSERSWPRSYFQRPAIRGEAPQQA